MKKFVSQRTELDGRYNAVYIGKGRYNPESLGLLNDNTARDNAHNSKAILNDITQLKARELINSYVNKGLLVLLYNDDSAKDGLRYQGKSSTQPQKAVLYNTFAAFYPDKRKNVKFVDAAGLKSMASTLAKPEYKDLLNLSPQLQLIEQPIDYTQNANKIYRAGDTITYRFNTPSRSGLRASLYLGLDSALRLLRGSDCSLRGRFRRSGELSFRLPSGFPAYYFWELELADMTSA